MELFANLNVDLDFDEDSVSLEELTHVRGHKVRVEFNHGDAMYLRLSEARILRDGLSAAIEEADAMAAKQED